MADDKKAKAQIAVAEAAKKKKKKKKKKTKSAADYEKQIEKDYQNVLAWDDNYESERKKRRSGQWNEKEQVARNANEKEYMRRRDKLEKTRAKAKKKHPGKRRWDSWRK